jgi:hypothetical protein
MNEIPRMRAADPAPAREQQDLRRAVRVERVADGTQRVRIADARDLDVEAARAAA